LTGGAPSSIQDVTPPPKGVSAPAPSSGRMHRHGNPCKNNKGDDQRDNPANLPGGEDRG